MLNIYLYMWFTYVYEGEIYFKALVHTIMGSGKSRIHKVDQLAGNWQDFCVTILGQKSFSGSFSLYS